MRRTKRSGNYFFCLLINILLNLDGAIPGVILLVLHFWLNISIWWSICAFAAWILYLMIWMIILGWAGRCSSIPDKPKENKNPYSSGPYKPYGSKDK